MVLDQRYAAALCHGKLAPIPATISTKPSFAFSELIAAVAPRPLLLQVSDAKDAHELAALRQAAEGATAIAELDRDAEAPLVELSTLGRVASDASPGLRWLDTHLMRSSPRR